MHACRMQPNFYTFILLTHHFLSYKLDLLVTRLPSILQASDPVNKAQNLEFRNRLGAVRNIELTAVNHSSVKVRLTMCAWLSNRQS